MSLEEIDKILEQRQQEARDRLNRECEERAEQIRIKQQNELWGAFGDWLGNCCFSLMAIGFIVAIGLLILWLASSFGII